MVDLLVLLGFFIVHVILISQVDIDIIFANSLYSAMYIFRCSEFGDAMAV